MARDLIEIEKEIRALSRKDQVRLLRALLNGIEAPNAESQRALRADIEIDLAAANEYVARHGDFADLAREHFRSMGE